MTERSLTDITGKVIVAGDYVVYPQSSGRAVQMVVGKVVKIGEKTVSVQRVGGSRWSAGTTNSRYIDSRTGKGIEPWSASGKHIEEEGYYRHRVTGEKAPHDVVWRNPRDYEWVPTKFKDYVTTESVAAPPSIIRNVSNLVKVEFTE